MVILSQKPRDSYKYLPFLAMLYILLQVFLQLLVKKVFSFPVIGILPVSLFLTGLFFILSDIITEVYGYKESQKLFMCMLIINTIYCFSMQFFAHLPSPANFFVSWSSIQDPNAYEYLFGDAIHFYIGVLISYLAGIYLNMYLISKWKILLKGRYFWLRSIGASGIAAIIFSIVSVIIIGVQTMADYHNYELIIKIILSSFCIKIATLIILAYPATLICFFLKRAEGVDVYDYGVNYNPFKKSETESDKS